MERVWIRAHSSPGEAPWGKNGAKDVNLPVLFPAVRRFHPCVAGVRLQQNFPPPLQAPIWPFVMFQAIAKYVFGTGNVFEPNETCPMEDYFRSKEIDTTLGGFMLMEDPEIEGYETERGRVRFIQMVGVTLEECKDAIRWNTEGFLKLVLEHYPLGVTYLHRGVCLDCLPCVGLWSGIRARGRYGVHVAEHLRRRGSQEQD